MSIALLVISLILFLLGLAGFIIMMKKYVKDRAAIGASTGLKKISSSSKITDKKQLGLTLGSYLALSLSFLVLTLGIFLGHPEWQSVTSYVQGPLAGQSISYAGQLAYGIIGSILFGLSFVGFWGFYSIHFLKKNVDKKERKIFDICLYTLIPVFIISFFLWTQGFGAYLSYPLPNGFTITSEGIFLTYAGHRVDGFHIAFYGILIITGVFICYFYCDHYFYKKYGKHGILDTLVLVAFPSGVIGARIWYVVGNWNREFAGRDWTDVFAIWDGGLTILGGAAAGVIAGYIFLRLRRKYVDPRWAIDVCVPSILLAQAMGRMGNFFNCEVYGQTVSSAGWQWLPNWIINQMGINNNGSLVQAGFLNVPLFLIEALINIAGFFLITVVIKRLLKKWLVNGDLAGVYFMWYGIVRLIMEPTRNTAFTMGTDNAWSVVNSIAYIAIGLAIIAFLHLHDYYQNKKNIWPAIIVGGGLLFSSLFLPFAKSITVVEHGKMIASLTGFEVLFNNGSPLFMVGFVFLLIAFVALIAVLILYLLKEKEIAQYVLFGSAGAALISAAFMFLGTNNLTLYAYPEASVNLSYGFAITALLEAIFIAGTLGIVLGKYIKKKPLPEPPGIKKENITSTNA